MNLSLESVDRPQRAKGSPVTIALLRKLAKGAVPSGSAHSCNGGYSLIVLGIVLFGRSLALQSHPLPVGYPVDESNTTRLT